jgi:hypothetical protein
MILWNHFACQCHFYNIFLIFLEKCDWRIHIKW